MSLSVSKNELLEFHRTQYASSSDEPLRSIIREFIDAKSPTTTSKEQFVQAQDEHLEVGDLIIDEEALVPLAHSIEDDEDAKAYLEYRQRHRAQFLQEIQDKHLQLKTDTSVDRGATAPMVEDSEPVRKRNQSMLNY